MKFSDVIPRLKDKFNYKVGRVVDRDGNQFWYFTNFKQHRDGGEPAYVGRDGRKEWWKYGELHRIGGPAIEGALGDREWWVNGKRHREDGPAVERIDGTKEWWIDGKRHREDGPAVEKPDGTKEWWRNGEIWPEGKSLAPIIHEEKKAEQVEKAVKEATIAEDAVKILQPLKFKKVNEPGM